MSDKKEDCFVSAMRVAFIIIVLLLIFLCGFSFIYYSEINLDSKISSFFSFVSSFGIIATIIVYFFQKKSDDKKQKNKNDILNRNIKTIINEKKYAIEDIITFINSSFQEENISFKVESSEKVPVALMSLVRGNELFQYQPIRVSNNELLKEVMSARYIASNEIAQSIEELNQIIFDLDKHVSMVIIDKLSRNDFPDRVKIKILEDFRDSMSPRYISRLDQIMQRI